MPFLKVDKQMKCCEYDCRACASFSATKWMDNKSVISLWNYHDPRAAHYIKRRVNGSKDKLEVSCATVIHEYNQYMGGVHLSEQMKISSEVDQRNKFRSYQRVFFDFLDICVVNSKIVYDKIQSSLAMSSINFLFTLACSVIGNFCNRKRAVPTSRPSKRSKDEKVVVVDHLLQLMQGVLIVLQKRLRAAYSFVA